jgi:hypothetical protein
LVWYCSSSKNGVPGSTIPPSRETINEDMGGEHDIALLKLRMDHYWGWLLGRNHMSRFWEIGKQIRIPQRSPDLVRYTGLCQHVMTCGFKELLGQWTSISFQC